MTTISLEARHAAPNAVMTVMEGQRRCASIGASEQRAAAHPARDASTGVLSGGSSPTGSNGRRGSPAGLPFAGACSDTSPAVPSAPRLSLHHQVIEATSSPPKRLDPPRKEPNSIRRHHNVAAHRRT
eukprot:6373253-Prymnesium_polylepis.1